MGSDLFTTPKPVRLLDRILRIATGPDDLVLDFFAGSGTTGHAVLKLNAEDGGNRRFILVSNTEATAEEPEKNLCRDVCARRVRRVIEGFDGAPGLGGDFAYLRARRVPLDEVCALVPEQVWLAVALFHLGTVPANASGGSKWYAAATGGAGVAYLPQVNREAVEELRGFLEKAEVPQTVYAHQVSALRQRLGLPEVEILPVPETILQRFRLEATP
jgi:adenine-specific DNA-methyltransferase